MVDTDDINYGYRQVLTKVNELTRGIILSGKWHKNVSTIKQNYGL